MNSPDNSKRSVSIRSPRPAAWLRLFCFPYAGGGASIYNRWSQNLPVNIEVAGVQLPGREWRIQEPLLDSIAAMVDDALDSVGPYLDKPFALLGTSMGGTLVFELARRLRAEGLPQPVCIVPCASGAPHIPEPVLLHKMSDAELFAELAEYGVMSDQVRDHPELAEMFLPLIRNDCMVHETYTFTAAPPLACPIWVYGGLYDATISRERLDAWSQHTEAETQVHMVDGGHLFVDAVPDMFLASLSRRLLTSLEKVS